MKTLAWLELSNQPFNLGEISLTWPMEKEGVQFFIFRQHYRPPQNKIDKEKNVEDKQEGGNVAKKMQSTGRWKSESVNGELSSFFAPSSMLPIILILMEMALTAYGIRWPRGKRAFLTAYPAWTWYMLYFSSERRCVYIGSFPYSGENVLFFYSLW